ncbi:MAG: tyrosine--tRNA ligase [Candidatus Omnitrophica bacterium]|nr:tyrosine--tRNA ligase [Candidatus Omnitrophota bacterium]
MITQEIERQLAIIKRGIEEIVSEEELRQKLKESLKSKRPLIIKAGFDPTAPDIHLGHTVLLRKMRQFQELGHRVIFLIGDFTGQIGDPTGQDKTRKRLSEEEVKRNALTYKKQVFKILDEKKTEVVFNSSWFKRMSSTQILELSAHTTLAQLLARHDFNQRYNQGKDISLLEFFYPLLQAYDSVYLKADVEIGGIDQKFNLLLGRELQKDFGQNPQVIIMLPLLEGTDGLHKMSKSFGNYIGIDEPANEMFGKIMSISDELMLRYYTLLTDEDLNLIKNMHPKEAKLRLAELMVSQYHSQEKAHKARLEFERVFSQKEVPQDIPLYKLSLNETILDILTKAGLVQTKNEARRLIKQKAVTLNEKIIDNEKAVIVTCGILKVGKRRFLKLER